MKYVYYRIYKFYLSHKESNPKSMAELVITTVLIFLLWGVFLFTILIILDIRVSFPESGKYAIPFVMLVVYTSIRLSPFGRNVLSDYQRISIWENEAGKAKHRNGWIIFFSIFIILGFGLAMSAYTFSATRP